MKKFLIPKINLRLDDIINIHNNNNNMDEIIDQVVDIFKRNIFEKDYLNYREYVLKNVIIIDVKQLLPNYINKSLFDLFRDFEDLNEKEKYIIGKLFSLTVRTEIIEQV